MSKYDTRKAAEKLTEPPAISGTADDQRRAIDELFDALLTALKHAEREAELDHRLGAKAVRVMGAKGWLFVVQDHGKIGIVTEEGRSLHFSALDDLRHDKGRDMIISSSGSRTDGLTVLSEVLAIVLAK